MAPCAMTATQFTENFERPSHLPNYTHNQPLCPSILYPNTSDPTTNVFQSYQTSLDPYQILPDKFGSCRLSVRRPLTRGQRAYIRRGGRSTNILFIPKR